MKLHQTTTTPNWQAFLIEFAFSSKKTEPSNNVVIPPITPNKAPADCDENMAYKKRMQMGESNK